MVSPPAGALISADPCHAPARMTCSARSAEMPSRPRTLAQSSTRRVRRLKRDRDVSISPSARHHDITILPSQRRDTHDTVAL
jgi:hypothetical protein